MIEKRKNNAYRKINEEMILLYFEVSKFLYELKENNNYGDKQNFNSYSNSHLLVFNKHLDSLLKLYKYLLFHHFH